MADDRLQQPLKMNESEDVEVHTIEIDGEKFRIANDPWTGDWAVEEADKEYPQPTYVTTKDGAIEYVLEKSGMKKYGGYRIAPDRTSS